MERRERKNMRLTKFVIMKILLILFVVQISLFVVVNLEGSLMIEYDIPLSVLFVFSDSSFFLVLSEILIIGLSYIYTLT